MSGYRISDKSNFSKAFILPDTVIQPGAHVLVWASDYPNFVQSPTIIRGAGAGIGHWRGQDSAYFFSLPVNGDFTASIRLHNLHGSISAEAGLILREENKPISRYCGPMAHTDASIWYHFNPVTEQSSENGFFSLNSFYGGVNFPDVWLKIWREGDTVISFSSLDNSYWHEGSRNYFPLKNNSGFVGLAFASSNGLLQSQVGFSEFRLNGREYSLDELTRASYNCKPASTYSSHEIHMPFSLSQSGEKIYLWKPDGSIEDTLRFGIQRRNISYGIDGNGHKAFFNNPTPGEMNQQVGELGIIPDPAPLMTSGYHNQPFSLNIKQYTDTSVRIYYTVDLSEPSEKSALFKQSLQITGPATVKFRAFRAGYIPSRTVIRTFLFEAPPHEGIATIFLTADEADFFGEPNGIWKNIESEREVPIHIELNDADKEIFSVDMGAKNHGYTGRLNAQKPLDIQLSSEFGDGEITQTIFPEKQASGIKKLLLRNASQDWNYTLLRDALASRLGLGLELDAQGYRPVRAYFNGKYWGMYQLREKTEESFLASNHDIDDKAVDLMGALGRPLQGNSAEWNASILALSAANTADDSVFAVLAAPFDLRNFIRYWGLEIFAMNTDWPGNNLKAWRCGEEFPLWRFIVLDNDLSFNTGNWDTDFNMFDYLLSPQQTLWANQPHATALFRGFMRNNNFKYRFLSRMADFLNTSLAPQNTIALLDSLVAQIESEIPLHTIRWPGSAIGWKDEVERVRAFLRTRPDFLRKHAMATFDIPGLTSLTVQGSVESAGAIRINSLQIPSGEFKGVYFRDIPTYISAFPKANFEFVGWKFTDTDTLYSTDREIALIAERDSMVLMAVYRQTGSSGGSGIVINEIMYKAPDTTDPKDWVELYNSGSIAQDISGWTIKDDNDSHTFTVPSGTAIPSNGFLIVAEDSIAMRKLYNYPFSIVGQFDFGLGRGDAVRIYDMGGALVDSVRYDRRAPWPSAADGTGASLELADPQSDNLYPENWKASVVHLGTPGKRNSVYEPQSTDEYSNYNFDDTAFSIFPNPMSERAFLRANISAAATMRADIYDILGRLVWSHTGHYASGRIIMELPAALLSAGLYRCTLYSIDGTGNFYCTTISVSR